jgi:hypothetical protein
MFQTLYAQIGAVFMVAMGVFAFLKGNQTEQVGAGAFLLAWLASLLVQEESNLREPQWIMFLVDLALLATFAALAWRAKRSWPVWASAVQLIVVASHIMTLMHVRASATSLYVVMNLSSYIIIGCIIVGTFWAWQERRAAGLE